MNWEPLTISQFDLNWIQAQEQQAREIARIFNVPPQLINEVSTNTATQAIYDLKEVYGDTPSFLISPEAFRKIQCMLSRRPHQRLLRKCQLRKIYRRRTLARRRHR